MGDTLVDRPYPTIPDAERTLDDLVPPPLTEPSPPGPTAPDPPSRTSRGRVVAIALAIVAAVLVVAGVALYLFVWRYEPVARRHIPGNANLAARVDAADLALFGPVRKHLLPILKERTKQGPSRDDRLADATGISLTRDLREIVVASVDTSSWVVIAGGRFTRKRFVSGFEEVAREEGWRFQRDGDLLIGPGGVTLAQADDGAIVVGTDRAIVVAALPASDDHRRLALPDGGAATFAITKQAWSGAAGVRTVASATVLRQVERAEGRFVLGSAPEITMSIEPAPGVEPAALAREIERVLVEMRLLTFLLPDVAGEKGAIAGARAKAAGERVELTAPWPYEGLDRACARLAALLR